ncbi:MAG: hypothetical protein RKL24_01705, partial [Defluviicoccus sp.]|nr:hypothetical protein [Defluviicoccus sp.]
MATRAKGERDDGCSAARRALARAPALTLEPQGAACWRGTIAKLREEELPVPAAGAGAGSESFAFEALALE